MIAAKSEFDDAPPAHNPFKKVILLLKPNLQGKNSQIMIFYLRSHSSIEFCDFNSSQIVNCSITMF